MSTDQVLSLVKRWGLEISLRDGKLHLVGPDLHKYRIKVLLKVLHYHKERIIQRMSKSTTVEITDERGQRQRECLWANGFIGRHVPGDLWPPVGAREWRYVGEDQWRSIPEHERPQKPSSGWTWQWPVSGGAGSYPAVTGPAPTFLGTPDGSPGGHPGPDAGERTPASSAEVAAEIRALRDQAGSA